MRRKILIGIAALVFLCLIVAIFSQSAQKPASAPTPASLGTPAPVVSEASPKATTPPPPTATARPPTATPTPLPKVGQTLASGNWEYTVTSIEKAKTLTWSDYGNTTEAKGIWLIVYLTLKNIGKENFSIYSWDFELNDATGVKYSISTDGGAMMFVSYKKLARLGEQIPPGVPVKTALIFDIAPDARELRLQLKQAKTSIDLGQ